jgi:hypothetical protein
MTGKTALHLACMSRDKTEGKRLRTVVELVRLGASLSRKDFRGFTALHHAATTGDRALIEALVSKGAKAERDIFGLQPVDILPIGSDHTAFGNHLETPSCGFNINVLAGMSEDVKRPDFYFDIEVSVPRGRRKSLFVQVCHAVDGNYCLKRLPPLYKLIGATRLSTGGTRTTAAVISLRVNGLIPNRKYRVLCEQDNGDVVAISNPLLVSKESIRFQSQCEDYMNVEKTKLIDEVRKKEKIELDIPMPATVQDALSALNTSLDELENDAIEAEVKASPTRLEEEEEEEKEEVKPVRLSIAKVYNDRDDDDALPRFKSRSLQWDSGSDEDTTANLPTSMMTRPTSLRWESSTDLDDAIDKAGTAL